MLLGFFSTLREGKVPVSIREFLDLINALNQHLVYSSIDDFYMLSRTCLVKDEKHYDKFDAAFAKYFEGVDNLSLDMMQAFIPEEWLSKQIEKTLSKEEFEQLKQLGDLDKLLEEFQKRLAEQKKRHQGGNKMIGTGGTSPFGHSGYHPEGIRVGGESRNKSAAKVWEKREFKDLDDSVELGTRNMKVALRKLRKN